MHLAAGIIDDRERPVKVVLVSTYADCVPTFGVLTEEGAFYVDVPASHLCAAQRCSPIALEQVAYRNCPASQSWFGVLPALQQPCTLFGRDKVRLGAAAYCGTLDWPHDNWMVHLFLAQDGVVGGRLLVWPHYRVLWSERATSIPQGFQKVRETWRLPSVG